MAGAVVSHLRGHVLLFDAARLSPPHTALLGARMLLTAAALEALRVLIVPTFRPPLWIFMPLLLVVALAAVRTIAGVSRRQIGFKPWREWTLTERSYFIQIIIIANVVFLLVLGESLRTRMTHPGAMTAIATVFVPYLFFGFYQEVVYRGLVQTALVRRWGAAAGILAANVLFTFGPLHDNYYLGTAPNLPMLGATFAIGLLFGVILQRSDNLWIVAVMHAIGNAYMVFGAPA